MFIFSQNTPPLRLTEVFHSIQGEGPLIGLPMVFVRTNRCNLRCKWCDSTYTFEGGYEESVDKLLQDMEKSKETWICFTGGEPLLQRDALDFVRKVTHIGKKVLIETSGSLEVQPYCKILGTVIDMDVKTPSSGEENSIRLDNLENLRSTDYLKFVISDETDYRYFVDFLKRHSETIRCGIVVQPAWGTDLKWLTEKILEDEIDARVLPQLHKIIWGEVRGV